MYLDFKIIAWERVFIPEEHKEEVLKDLKDGKIQTSNDAIFLYESKGANFDGIITECEEQMTPQENGGYSTVELLTDDGENPLFKNGK